jgi:phosphoribosylanthranilate isomerase
MLRTRVKICGICRSQDAAAAARAGADAVGIVFDPTSRRRVSVDEAVEIVAALPPFVMPVGLFVDVTKEEIRRVLQLVPLAAVQLQGDEPPELIAELKPVRVIKALHLAPGDTPMLDRWRNAISDFSLTNLIGLLLETASTGRARGGTGVANNFAALHSMQKAGNFSGLPPIIAAGGLTPATVGDVVRMMRPFAVDVSSGVESNHREKSAEQIDAFVCAVRAADA